MSVIFDFKKWTSEFSKYDPNLANIIILDFPQNQSCFFIPPVLFFHSSCTAADSLPPEGCLSLLTGLWHASPYFASWERRSFTCSIICVYFSSFALSSAIFASGARLTNFFIVQHSVYTGKLLRKSLFLLCEPLDLLFNVYQLRKGHINCSVGDDC